MVSPKIMFIATPKMGDLIKPELMSSGFFLQIKVVWRAYERFVSENTGTRVTSDVRR